MTGQRPLGAAAAMLAIGGLALGWLALHDLPSAQGQEDSAVLTLSILDETTGRPVPARLEILDANRTAFVAEDAVRIGAECVDRPSAWTGGAVEAAALLNRTSFQNPYTDTRQFYSAGRSKVTLPPGSYHVRIWKGIEYHVQERDVTIQKGKAAALDVRMSRWIDMSRKGWYSADTHLHIPRPRPELNAPLSKWMQAEDIHFAGLLQWGNWKHFNNGVQYAHGAAGVYREGDYFLMSGQEHPRTDILGHTIILGASSAIDVRGNYLLYKPFWEEARRRGGLGGYAHWGEHHEASSGFAVNLPDGLLSFVEVLQLEKMRIDTWYDALNVGFRLAPVAGTDFPCISKIPGQDRFYTRIQGKPTFDGWREGIRAGRTFVTNGPILDLRAGGREIGDELVLEKAGPVTVEVSAHFDPGRDDIEKLEVVQDGDVVRLFPRQAGTAEISGSFILNVNQSTWLAARSYSRNGRLASTMAPVSLRPSSEVGPVSVAHTAPIYVSLRNGPARAALPRAWVAARRWRAKLENLEERLTKEAPSGGRAGPDEIALDYMLKNREVLLAAVRKAKAYFNALAH